MQRKIHHRHLGLGLAVASSVLAAAIVAAFFTRSALERDIESLERTLTVIDHLHRLERLVFDAESRQRGYLLTEQDPYLEGYRNTVTELTSITTSLLDLTIEQPAQRSRILAIERATGARLSALERVIEVDRNEGFDAARELIKESETGHTLELVDSMLADQKNLLAAREKKRHQRLLTLTFVIALAAAVSIASSLIGYMLFRRAEASEARRRALALQKAEAERADREKSAFLANMSHEIRTPMNAILGFADLLDDLVSSPREKHYVEAITSSGHILLQLINDILDLSKIESGRLELSPSPSSLSEVGESIKTLFTDRARETGLGFDVTVDGDSPDVVVVDRLRLRQVLINLVSNALKFTERGHVRVRIAARRNGPAADLTATVADTGAGISAERLEEIFRPFVQDRASESKAGEGTGLGLTISRRLAMLMGGDIDAESAVGEGSTFTLHLPDLPLAAEAEPDRRLGPKVDFAALPPLKVLVADDNQANRELISGMFHGAGHKLVEAPDGKAAVDLARREKPDVVLMDIRMPVMDGRQAREHIKSDPETSGIPVIAVTASSLKSEEQRLRDLFDGFVRKPVSQAQLFSEIYAVAGGKGDGHHAATGRDGSAEPDGSAGAGDDGGLELTALAAEFISARAPDLLETMAIGEISAFAKELGSLAESEDDPALAALAGGLDQACDGFQLGEIRRTLERLADACAADGEVEDPPGDEDATEPETQSDERA